MPVYFPQIYGSKIMTQAPYSAGLAYQTVVQDVETGMRFTYPYRGVGLTNFSPVPLGKFGVNFSTITDAEVATLKVFFESVRGSWGSFRFLDPGGNLLKYSEDFSQTDWTKTATLGGATTDPFGGTRATAITAGSLKAVIGPSDGFMSTFIMNVSVYLQALSGGVTANIGISDSTSTLFTETYSLPSGTWLRISHAEILADDGIFKAYVSVSGPCNIFGAQVSPMKGSGAYVKTPGNYGYHANCRFDTDAFTRQAAGPNQNSLQLPIVEFYA